MPRRLKRSLVSRGAFTSSMCPCGQAVANGALAGRSHVAGGSEACIWVQCTRPSPKHTLLYIARDALAHAKGTGYVCLDMSLRRAVPCAVVQLHRWHQAPFNLVLDTNCCACETRRRACRQARPNSVARCRVVAAVFAQWEWAWQMAKHRELDSVGPAPTAIEGRLRGSCEPTPARTAVSVVRSPAGSG